MKRYFVVDEGEMPSAPEELQALGQFHYINLGSIGSAGTGSAVVCLCDELTTPPAVWYPLMALTDPVSTLGDSEYSQYLTQLSVVGATATTTGYKLAKLLGQIHSQFNP